MMLGYLKLKNVGTGAKMEMELASRLNIVTGDNGLGKSFLLDVAWWALTRRWPRDLNQQLTSGYPAKPMVQGKDARIGFRLTTKAGANVSYESKYVPREEAWRGKQGRPWNPGLIIYAHADGGFSVWDPARNYWKARKDMDIPARIPGFVFSASDVWEGLEVEVDGIRTVVCNGLIRDWASWIREKGNPAKRMSTLLEGLAPPGESFSAGPLTRLSVSDVRDIPSIRTAYSDCVPIVHASSGVKRIIALAYMLLWSWEEHVIASKQLGEERTNQVVMLFDEIESHLHPRWQRSILSSVLDIASILHKQATVQLLAATHSPLVLASAEPIFDESTDKLFVLGLDMDEVSLVESVWAKQGDVVNWLVSDTFGLQQGRSLEAERAIEAQGET